MFITSGRFNDKKLYDTLKRYKCPSVWLSWSTHVTSTLADSVQAGWDSWGYVSQTCTHHQAPHLPPWCHFLWAVCSLSCDVVWPLSLSRDSGDSGCKPALACNVLSASGWPQFLHFGLLCNTKNSRLTQWSNEGHLGGEHLSGPWPWVIPRVIWGGRTANPLVKSSMPLWHTAGLPTLSRPLGFHKYQSLGGW